MLLGAESSIAKSYRTINESNAPVWDEYIPENETSDYSDKYDIESEYAYEWGWWSTSEPSEKQKVIRDTFWNPDVDYNSFEELSTRESIDNRKLILADTRSCPDGETDTAACKEWLASPHTINKLPESLGYVPLVHEPTTAEKEVEALLKLKKEKQEKRDEWNPKNVRGNVWSNNLEFQNCPFDTERECLIWKNKPTVPETIGNRMPMIPAVFGESLIALSRAGKEITADMDDARPLLNRYKALLAASNACCTSGIIHNLQELGASPGLIYKFLVDDANFYQFGERCLMITDDELRTNYANTSTAYVVADVRNTCLCQRKEYFESLLAPFVYIANASDNFANSAFEWQYTDGLKRRVFVSINYDVNVVLNQLSNCPD